MKPLTFAIVAALSLVGIIKAERPLSVFDNGVTDIKSVEAQAVLFEELGYDGICTRPDNASDELLTAMDKHGRKVSATYVVIPAKAGGEAVPPKIVEHFKKLKGRKTIVWLGLTNPTAKDEVAVSLIRRVCDSAAENGLEVVLYPHVGFRTNTVAECERLRKMADRPELGVSFNLCHFLCQNDPSTLESTIKSVAPHLKLIQICGADEIPPGKPDWKRLIQPLGEGSFDVGRVFRVLDEVGYKGPFNLQCYNIDLPSKSHLSASMQAWEKYNKNTTDQ